MRISDWSSDVCSSDLAAERRGDQAQPAAEIGHDLARDRQAKAEPVGAPGDEGGEKLRLQRLGHAGAVVADVDAQRVAAMDPNRDARIGAAPPQTGRESFWEMVC